MVAPLRPEYLAALAELGKAGRVSVGTFHALGGRRSGPSLTWMVGHELASVRPVPVRDPEGPGPAGWLWELEITAQGRELLQRRKLAP